MLQLLRSSGKNLIAGMLLVACAACAQQPQNTHSTMTINAFATPDPGDLTPSDFRLLDNQAQKTLISARRLTQAEEPVHLILAIDSVNTSFTRVAYVRDEVQKFMQGHGRRLAFPTTFVVVSDHSTELQKGFSTDGSSLSEALSSSSTGLRTLGRSSGFWGADERVSISLRAFQQLTAYAATIPGRKLLIWISPGWPLLSGARVSLDEKQQQRIFTSVVAFSKELQQANLTLYSINPLGPKQDLLRADYYESFLKGVKKPAQTDVADLSLQVLALQSGGRAFTGNSDVAGNIEKCLADARSWYELTFPLTPSEHPDEYHHLQVQVIRQGVTVRTRDGYYSH